MKELTSHQVNGFGKQLNDHLQIQALDEPGPGGANHHYRIVGYEQVPDSCCEIHFQNGAIGEIGVNGISNEALLAIVEDRLVAFQAGTFSCRENAIALTHIQDAINWLHRRTRERMDRGVEGTTQK